MQLCVVTYYTKKIHKYNIYIVNYYTILHKILLYVEVLDLKK